MTPRWTAFASAFSAPFHRNAREQQKKQEEERDSNDSSFAALLQQCSPPSAADRSLSSEDQPRRLALGALKLTPVLVRVLARQALAHNKSVTELGQWWAGKKDMLLQPGALHFRPLFETCDPTDISRVGLSDEEGPTVGQMLKTNMSIHTLDLSGNYFGYTTAKALRKALEVVPLEAVERRRVRRRGVRLLLSDEAAAVHHAQANTSLRSLNLSFCGLDAKVPSTQAVLSEESSAPDFQSSLTSPSVEIAKSLRVNKTLRHLFLRANFITAVRLSRVKATWTSAPSAGQTTASSALESCDFLQEAADSLLQQLRFNGTLVTLDLTQNQLSKQVSSRPQM